MLATVQLMPPWASAQPLNPETEAVLNAAEGVFKAMKARDFPAIWAGLTAKTKEEIVKSVLKGAAKTGYELTTAQLRNDFAVGGPQASAYWRAYLDIFDPDLVLEQSRWSLGSIKGAEARVIIHYRKSENPANLLLKKEDGAWRIGLEETFAPRRWILEK
ncbi:MAG: hypothetical protein QM278_06575 [Pseudomonadota bacterium]|nr:hypothetical protein [Pseudomonadota bacterium]